MATVDQSPAELKMTQGYKFLEKIHLDRVAYDTAKRTLGTWIKPQGTMNNKDPTLPSEFSIKKTADRRMGYRRQPKLPQ